MNNFQKKEYLIYIIPDKGRKVYNINNDKCCEIIIFYSILRSFKS
jgi:hypothetical protein